MRWQGQQIDTADAAALPGMEKLSGFVRSVTTPEFADVTFHEVMSKSALNHVPGPSSMPFDWTVNPYRGCSHACAYCLAPDTLVLMADGRQRRIADLAEGDVIVGTEAGATYRRYVETTVLAHWATRKQAYRVTLADGTEIVASGDHRFLTERGWKHVTGSMAGTARRPFLTTNNRLMGFGVGRPESAPTHDRDFGLGYLSGMIRGDGMIFHGEYSDEHRTRRVHRFRLALADSQALERTRVLLEGEGVSTYSYPFASKGRPMRTIQTARGADVARVEALIRPPAHPSDAWYAGFLSGVFDAEGSCSRGILRISNSDRDILDTIARGMDTHGISHVVEPPKPNGVASVRVTGGLAMRQKFFARTGPAITRKMSLVGTAVKTSSDLRVVSIEPDGDDVQMFDITTGTGDFIANGVISHNCFARGTHEYLDFDAGRDFDTQVVVKVNVADVLRRELARPSWQREHVALGTNTDPYQRAEGRYRLMPGIITALTESGTPFSILTKGTLLRRDLPLLQDAARWVDVSLAMSIAVFDDALQRSLEPGTPSAAARLETVRAATAAGFRVTVFLMPVLPHLTDSIAALDDALGRIRAAGAVRVVYGAMHLRPGVKPWFLQWLGREHPELVSSYAQLYPGASVNAPKDYRRWLARRIRPLMRAHGLDGHDEEAGPPRPARARTGPVRVTAKGAAADPAMLF